MTTGRTWHPRHRLLGFAVALVVVTVLLSNCSTGGTDAEPSIDLGGEEDLVDSPFSLAVSGLAPRTAVTVTLRATDEEGRTWASWGRFTSDRSGRVDTAEHSPETGSYTGTEPAGLLWSMREPDDAPPDDEVLPEPAGPRLRLDAEVRADGHTVNEHVTRLLHDPGVRSFRVGGENDEEPVGDLYLPAGDGPHPGVVLLGGSEGGRPSPTLARLLASHGFATLGLAYFGVEGRPAGLERIPVEYGTGSVEWLLDHPEVGGDRAGMVGMSKGGEYALLVGAHSQSVGAVVSVVGSGVAFSGVPDYQESEAGPPGSSWTLDGQEVPHIEPAFDTESTSDVAEQAARASRGHPMDLSVSYTGGLAQASREELAAARIPVERIDAPALLVSGGQDSVWPESLLEIAWDGIEGAGNPHGSEYLRHPEAGHSLLGAPNLPMATSTAVPLAGSGMWADSGGSPRANHAAVDATFEHTLELFEQNLNVR